MRVWITQYALSVGIEEREGYACHNPTMIEVRDPSVRYFHGGNWHTSESAAQAKAEQMRVDKISSLKRQIGKLEKMRFA